MTSAPAIVNDGYELVDAGSLQPHPENPNRGNAELIRDSIAENGFYGAVVVQKSSRRIIIGEHRWRELVAAGAGKVPVIWADVDDAHARKIMEMDNGSQDARLGYDPDRQLALVRAIVGDADPAEALRGTSWTAERYEELLRESGALGAEATAFLDDYLHPAGDSQPPDLRDQIEGSPTYESEAEATFALSYAVTADQRERVRAALTKARRADPTITTSQEALVAVCDAYVSQDPRTPASRP